MSDKLKSLIDDIESGVIKKITNDDTFNFECVQCGECCTNRNDIILNPIDVYMIVKGLNILVGKFIEKYCDIKLGSKTKIPIVAAKFIPSIMFGKPTMKCPFLKRNPITKEESYICSIQKFKPYVCAAYPLGRVTKMGESREVIRFAMPVDCKGGKTTKAQKVSQWLKDFNIEEHERLTDKYNDFLKKVFDSFDFEYFVNKFPIDREYKNKFLQVYLSIIYGGYPDENETESIELILDNRYSRMLSEIEVFKKLLFNSGLEINGVGKNE